MLQARPHARLAAALAIGGTALSLALPMAASAAPTPVAPINGAAATSLPTFSWTPVAGETSLQLGVSQSSAVGATGLLSSAAAVYPVGDAGATTFTPAPGKGLFSGPWFWQMTGTDAAAAGVFSPVQSFTVTPATRVRVGTPIVTKSGHLMRTPVLLTTNDAKVSIGSRIILNGRRRNLPAYVVPTTAAQVMVPNVFADVLTLKGGSGLKVGDRVSYVLIFTGPGLKQTVTRTFKVRKIS